MFYLNFYTKMIVRLKQLKEMNMKVALMYVIVCECDLYECLDVAVTFFLHAYIVPLPMFYMYMYRVAGRNKAVLHCN